MDLCSSGHDEVCFSERYCPVCQIIDEKDKTISELNDRIEELETQNERLQGEE